MAMGTDLSKMDRTPDENVNSDSDKSNGHHEKKKSLRVKVPQNIKLRNVTENSENFDVLHCHMDSQISHYVSIRTFICVIFYK